MAIDTTEIDAQIADLTSQVATAQSNFDADPFTIALNQHKALGSTLADLTTQLSDLQKNRDQMIALDEQINSLSNELSALQTTVSVSRNQGAIPA